MRVLISALGYALASLALGPANSGIVLAMCNDALHGPLVMPRFLPPNRARSILTGGADFDLNRCPTVDRGDVFFTAAEAKRARKAARRLELAA